MWLQYLLCSGHVGVLFGGQQYGTQNSTGSKIDFAINIISFHFKAL